MNRATDLLIRDHRYIRGLLHKLLADEIRSTETPEAQVERIVDVLEIHSIVEDEFFYPAVEKVVQTPHQAHLLAIAREEHRIIEEQVIPDLQRAPISGGEFGARAQVLRNLVGDHADEEESLIFPIARRLLSQTELVEIGEAMMTRKQALQRRVRPMPQAGFSINAP